MNGSRKGVSMRRVVPPYAMVTVLTLAFAPVAFAQRISGEITGTVVDENRRGRPWRRGHRHLPGHGPCPLHGER